MFAILYFYNITTIRNKFRITLTLIYRLTTSIDWLQLNRSSVNIKRSINKRINKLFNKKKAETPENYLINLYQTSYGKRVLISYITTPFKTVNPFKHQNYITSHIVAESFSELGYDVDVVDFLDRTIPIIYENYDVIFGIGDNFERSFQSPNRNIPRIHFITGAHQDLHNQMSLRSIKDFYRLSNIWLTDEANVLPESCYYAMFNADVTIILAKGFIFEDCKNRFENKLHSLNNNILGIFSSFTTKTKRTSDFLFLSGGRQITKGLYLLLELARLRKDLNFYVVVPHINDVLETYYKDVLTAENVFLYKDIRMDGDEMKNIIDTCSYVLAPSYIDGLPGGTIEPMSAGLLPIVSKYCGFEKKRFIIEIDELSVDGLNSAINAAIHLDDHTYFEYINEVKEYTIENFSKSKVKTDLKTILKSELFN